ncbi:MAG: FapA family protein, partial [Desulfuromonadales bacterium]
MAEKMFIKGADAVSRFEVKRYGYTLTFEISPDALECLCDYEPTTIGGTPLTEAELQAHLAQFKITEGILPESYAALLKVAANLTSVSGLLLARGVPMIPGEDGEIIIGAGDDSEEMEPDEKTGTVNFRNVQAFVNANEGDLVATIKRPGSGTPGKTVTGNIIPSLLGTPVKFKIGQNVKLGEDGHTIYAIDTGRVCLNDNVISVEDIYEIKGDVNFKVGNITFKGCVEVKGDVLDGFFVKATKGIKIQGNIGACVIESGGNISFCGMSGQGS